MIQIIPYAVMGCGLLCSSISIAYSFSLDKRSQRQSTIWLRRMFFFAGVGLLLLIGGAR